MKRQVTLKQWRQELGEALSLADAAKVVGRQPVDLARAAAARQLRVHRFLAADGKAYFMVRVEELLDYQRRCSQAGRLMTPEGMRRAFARMVAA